MLTGDKVDTAINIGHSCSLLNTDMTIFRLCADDDDSNVGNVAGPDMTSERKINGQGENNNGSRDRREGGGGTMGLGGASLDSEPVPVVVERTQLEVDASGLPSEASVRGYHEYSCKQISK